MLNYDTNCCDLFSFWDDYIFKIMISVVAVQLLSCVWLCQSHGLQHASFPLLHYLLEFAQTHAHWVDDAIPTILSSVAPSPFAFNFSQHQGLFQWVKLFTPGGQSTGALASALPIVRADFLEDWLIWSPCSPKDAQESSPAPQIESINSSALSLFNSPLVHHLVIALCKCPLPVSKMVKVSFVTKWFLFKSHAKQIQIVD